MRRTCGCRGLSLAGSSAGFGWARKGAPVPLNMCVRRRPVAVLSVISVLAFWAILGSSCTGRREQITMVPNLIKDTAFVRGQAAWLVTASGDLLSTADGGGAWHTVPGDSVGGFDRVSFLDMVNGWALDGKGDIWRSSDGGQTWVMLGRLEEAHFSATLVEQIRFTDETHGWAFDPFRAWKTEDGGVNWKHWSLPTKIEGIPASVGAGSFLSGQICWLGGGDGVICQTSDAGLNWRTQRLARTKEEIRALFFASPEMGWAAEWPRGTIYHTTDAGETWQPQDSPVPGTGVGSIYFLNENEGWAAGHQEPYGERTPYKSIGLLLHTEDGGQTWRIMRTDDDALWYDTVFFSDPNNGWLLGTGRHQADKEVDRDKLWRTTDGGRTWRLALDAESLKSLVSPASG
jgi:photosystem II stability/assembly factor-like uncharacterized protein